MHQSCASGDRDDQNPECVDEVVEDRALVNVHRVSVEPAAQAVGSVRPGGGLRPGGQRPCRCGREGRQNSPSVIQVIFVISVVPALTCSFVVQVSDPAAPRVRDGHQPPSDSVALTRTASARRWPH